MFLGTEVYFTVPTVGVLAVEAFWAALVMGAGTVLYYLTGGDS